MMSPPVAEARPTSVAPLLSLRWKSFLLFLLVFGALQVALTYQGYVSRVERMERDALDDLSSHEKVFAGLLRHGNDENAQRAIQLAATLNAAELQRSPQGEGLRSAAELFEDFGVVEYFSRSGKRLAGWTLEGFDHVGSDAARRAAIAVSVGRSHQPASYISCAGNCMQWIVVPAFDRNGNEIIVSVAYPLIGTLLAFEEMTGADVALAVPERTDPRRRVASLWGRDVLEATNAPRNAPLLEVVQARSPTPPAGAAHANAGKVELLLAFQLVQTAPETVEVLFIRNETERQARLRAETLSFLVFRLLVLLASAAAILVLLTPPMRRLEQVTNALPLLAEQRFHEALQLIDGARRRRGLRDEIDVLNDTAQRLADRLQKLIGIEAASAAKSHFLANMSHELRTPLNGVIGFAEILVDDKAGPINEEQREFLTDILNSARHLLRLINDLLDLSKVEAGRMELQPETFSIATAIEEVCAVARAIAQRRGIEIRVALAAEPDKVTLDAQRFKQVLYNLLSNAVKFSHDGGSVEVAIASSTPGRFRLAVTDHGIGIRAEDLPRLFREFEQLDSGDGRRYGGTGLGLALTRRLVELQHGTISAASAAGVGSTFTVDLPQHS